MTPIEPIAAVVENPPTSRLESLFIVGAVAASVAACAAVFTALV